MNAGIYKIENMRNGKFYIGSAVDIKKRFGSHRNALRLNEHHNNYLQNAWNKYGEESFKFEVLLFCEEKNLLFYEQRVIDTCQTIDDVFGYNVCPVAGNTLGVQHSIETKQKISEAMTGKILTKETKRKISLAGKGRVSWNEGKKLTFETKKKMSEARKGRVPWNKGIPCSEETKKKMSKSGKGRVFSEVHKERISKALKGITRSKETKRRISETKRRNNRYLEERIALPI